MTRNLSRRGYLRVVGSATAAVAVGPAAAGSAAAQSDESWRQLSCDARHTGVAPSNTAPRGEVAKLWSLGGDVYYYSPVVANGTVYVPSKSATYAVDAATGEVRWTFEERTPSAPAVVDGTVFVTTPTGLHAFDAESGEEHWHREITFASPEVIGSPVVADGRVYVAVQEQDVPVGRAFDAATGEQLFTVLDGNYSGFASPAVTDDAVYFVSSKGGPANVVFAFDPETGDPLWDLQLDSPIGSTPVVSDGTLYVGAGNRVVAVDTEAREQLWGTKIGQVDGVSEATVAVADGTVVAPSHKSYAYGLDAETGEKLWSTNLSGSVHSSPSVVDGTVFVGDSNGVNALDLSTGEKQWAVQVGRKVSTAPAVANGVVYAGGLRGMAAIGDPELAPVPETTTASGTTTATDDTDSTGSDDTVAADPSDATTRTSTDSGDGPGFGALAGLAGVTGAAGYLARRSGDED